MAESPFTQGPVVTYGAEKSRDYPVVACARSNILSSSNCMMAWLSTGSGNVTRWARGSVNSITNQFGMGSFRTHGYTGWQSPALTAQTSGTYPFLLGLKQGTTLYTWRYDRNLDTFVNERTAAHHSTGLLSGALGEFFFPSPYHLETHLRYLR